MKGNQLSKKRKERFWLDFFGIELGDIIEIKVKRFAEDEWHTVEMEIIGTYRDSFETFKQPNIFEGRVVKAKLQDLMLRTYIFEPSKILRIVKKHGVR